MDEPVDPHEEETIEVEIVDALPVVAEPNELIPTTEGLPAINTAAAAATGFLAGALTLAVLHRRNVRRLTRELRALKDHAAPVRPRTRPFPLEPGRSYLVHVRVLSRPPE